MSETIRRLQSDLNSLGFPCGAADGVSGPATRTALARFQLAHAFGRLSVDGVYGPQSAAALDRVKTSGRLSTNFSVGECRSKGDGSAWVHRELLYALERLRAATGKPLALVSCWRDPAHNRRVGGARTSQHTYGASAELHRIAPSLLSGAHLFAGRAADFNRGYIRTQDCVNLRIFSGIGHRDGWVTHVDIRTSASPANPTVWAYG